MPAKQEVPETKPAKTPSDTNPAWSGRRPGTNRSWKRRRRVRLPRRGRIGDRTCVVIVVAPSINARCRHSLQRENRLSGSALTVTLSGGGTPSANGGRRRCRRPGVRRGCRRLPLPARRREHDAGVPVGAERSLPTDHFSFRSARPGKPLGHDGAGKAVEIGSASLSGVRGRVAKSVAKPIARRTGLTHEQVEATIGFLPRVRDLSGGPAAGTWCSPHDVSFSPGRSTTPSSVTSRYLAARSVVRPGRLGAGVPPPFITVGIVSAC